MKEIEEKVLFTNYRLCLRDAVGDFTKQLINNLFDVNHLSESGERTRRSFLNILERLVLPPPGRASPSGGKRRRKRKRTRKKKRRN